MVFLQISQRRARLNGLDSSAPVAISPNVRGEMERALADLQQVLLVGEIEPLADDRPRLMISSTAAGRRVGRRTG